MNVLLEYDEQYNTPIFMPEEWIYGAPFVSKLLRKLWTRKTKIDLIYIFYTKIDLIFVATQNIDPIFITQKSTRFLLRKNRPDFYYAKIDITLYKCNYRD